MIITRYCHLHLCLFPLHDDTLNASGGQIVHSEPAIHQNEAYKPCGWLGDELLVEKASSDLTHHNLRHRRLLCYLDYLLTVDRLGITQKTLSPSQLCNDEQLFTLFEWPSALMNVPLH